ncbi:flavin-containing monooxygenase [Pseudohalioglobus lutimaris]|uniref:FAD-containing monooxygenase EthA n=1 Tax=Pseudohalioglobus lutimaris TaxID=1737061 RepID=A0A2N5X814_9GAMM|nr:NAD(P)/FAD-dependent oxidoreductase [Pseudohalioglobus lutimaris]PLW70630.1 FAD-containing monooxygenase EthA [Pseudohalioglobus lutimaris]
MEQEIFDVIVVGAGLSGIGAAYHLRDKCPDRSVVILEARDAIGGTWDLFRYPGIRSDSDMHTLGYNFKPWRAEKAIADGPSILKYVRDTAEEYGIDRKIRFQHRVVSADWSSTDSLWTVQVNRGETSEIVTMQCQFLLLCSGYYNYEHGHRPDFPGKDRFQGDIVYPQFWPQELDYSGKKVVVIGSGATAVTLVPSMAEKASEVVMLQRSPTYVISRPDKDRVANILRKILPESWAYSITRFKNTAMQQFVYHRSRVAPESVKRKLLKDVRKELGPDYDVDKHFTPRYNPWDQRLCLVPNSDLFKSIRSGKARVVTDHIETFTENGIQLKSGERLEADIIVSATGLELVVMGGASFSVDGAAVEFAREWTYKGLMVSGVPNLVSTFGYINASWTLRADLTAEWVCRVLNKMKATGSTCVVPILPDSLKSMPARKWIADFPAGYMERVMHLFPRQGDREPWINPQNYRKDRKMFLQDDLADGTLRFSSPKPAAHDSIARRSGT